MANEEKSETRDAIQEYDSKHGDPAKGSDHKPVNLTESSNKPPTAAHEPCSTNLKG